MWYRLHAPSMFNYAIMAHTPADSPEVVNGRVTELPLEQLTGDFNQKNFMIKFRVHETRGNNAFTSFDGHRLTSDYKRALTRRRNSRIDCNFVLNLQDNVQIRIKPIIMVDKRIKKSQEKMLRAVAHKYIEDNLSKLSLPVSDSISLQIAVFFINETHYFSYLTNRFICCIRFVIILHLAFF